MQFTRDKHVRFFNNCLNVFPGKLQSEDSNKLALVYFSLNGLDILNSVNYDQLQKQQLSEWLYRHLVPSGEGFRGSFTHELSRESEYDCANISSTYFAICCLLILGSDISKFLDREKIMKYISRCQLPSGGFCATFNDNNRGYGSLDSDVRYCLMAVQIRYLLKYNTIENPTNDIDIETLVRHMYSLKTYTGGLGGLQFQEAHSGLTFCGLACLKLVDRLSEEEEEQYWELTKRWLVQRQLDFNDYNKQESEYEMADTLDVGGFNGRENKFADTCYSWWNIGSLKILHSEHLINKEKAIDYLLSQTQHALIGGFGKTNEDIPDPLHSCLAICALSILNYNENQISKINELIVLSESTMRFYDSIIWK